MVIWFVLLIIGSYLLGSMPTGYLVGRWRRGIDIRQYGSGNVGASNVLALVSKRWSVAVMVIDIGKGALPVWGAQLIGLGAAPQATVGVVAIVGHNWPVFLHFQGGRGVFTSLGVITVLSPWLGLIAFVSPYLFFAPFRQVSMGVVSTMTILPICAWFASEPMGIEEPLPITLGMLAVLLIATFRRLSVPRSPLSATVSTGELIFNRFFFDRDIRDRKTWISHTRSGADEKEQLDEIEEIIEQG
ncbi:glycerol-3-phosphate acyltransferase [Chloroflexota bacterium]